MQYRIINTQIMATDPAFLFYPADASEDTQFMNMRKWMLHSGDGILEAVKTIYFDGKRNLFSNEEASMYYFNLYQETIYRHMLIK